MRYRRQTASGDYVFGAGPDDFFVDEPKAVAQAVETRLKLFVGEYFPDLTVGMPWQSQVLGFNSSDTYDAAIRNCISATQGFDSFVTYSSKLNTIARTLTVNAKINTIYSGQTAPLSITFLLSGYGVGGYSIRPYGD